MNLDIAILLAQDGLVNGAIYALLALALVLVFSVTRVIFVPQGEFVAFGALTLAAMQTGQFPGTVWLLMLIAGVTLVVEIVRALRGMPVEWWSTMLWCLAAPLACLAIASWVDLKNLPMFAQVLLTLLLVTPMGPLLYRITFRPLSDAPVLILLIAAVALHLVLMGLGLFFFGAEGFRTETFSDFRATFGAVVVNGQSIVVVGASLALIGLLYLFFEKTIYGKALRAVAINRVGARLMGIPTALSGDLCFVLAAFIGAMSGMLIAPLATIYYDTGFLIGLKGFVAAIIAGLASYPLAAVGAVLVGLLEAYASFWASAFKEVIVFTLIIPVLLWRSLKTHHVEEEH